jgi:hypothetical protein
MKTKQKKFKAISPESEVDTFPLKVDDFDSSSKLYESRDANQPSRN